MEINKILSLSKGDFGITQVANLSPSEIAALMSVSSKLGMPSDLDESELDAWTKFIKSNVIVTSSHQELLNLCTSGTLSPGTLYLISDFKTKVKSEVTNGEIMSTEEVYQVLVRALTKYDLDRNVKVIKLDEHSHSTMWDAIYDINPDLNNYDWVPTDNKGVIYWMKDIDGNEAPFDFNSIKFKRYTCQTPFGESTRDLVGQLTADFMCGIVYGDDLTSPRCDVGGGRTNSASINKTNSVTDYFKAIGKSSVNCKILSNDSDQHKVLPNLIVLKGVDCTIRGYRSTLGYISNSDINVTDSMVGDLEYSKISKSNCILSNNIIITPDSYVSNPGTPYSNINIGYGCSRIIISSTSAYNNLVGDSINIGSRCSSITLTQSNGVIIGDSCSSMDIRNSNIVRLGIGNDNVTISRSVNVEVGSDSRSIHISDFKVVRLGDRCSEVTISGASDGSYTSTGVIMLGGNSGIKVTGKSSNLTFGVGVSTSVPSDTVGKQYWS